MSKRKILIFSGVLCTLLICLVIIYFNRSKQTITLIYNNETEKLQQILISQDNYLDVFKEMKNKMELEVKDYKEENHIIYGHNIEIIEQHKDYYEAFYIYGTRVIYIKSLYKSEENTDTDNNNSDNPSILNKVTIPYLGNKEEQLEVSLYSVDEYYYNYFVDVYQKLKK